MNDVLQTIAAIRAFRAHVLEPYRTSPLLACSLSDVKRVVIINSSSRSGSSLLYALLRKLPQVCALTGEAAPFYKLNASLSGFNPHAGEKIPTELLDRVIDYEGLTRDFLSDLSGAEVETRTDRIGAAPYMDGLMLRLSLQWPDIRFEPDTLREVVAGAFSRYGEKNRTFCAEAFYLDLLEALHTRWPRINPFYYDIGTDKVALRFPFLEIPTGPPTDCFTIEEPPFILLAPRRAATPTDLGERVLLLKSTVDCYRMNLIERIFPAADIRVIHLVRNPAATINGLYDGWLHRGFFSHNLAYSFGDDCRHRLRIKGYSDRFPFGENWWNFDLPEGWQEVADQDLVQVCAFQWHAANTEILGHLAASQRSSCLVHFEEIIRSNDSRQLEFQRMLEFMGIPAGSLPALGLDALPVVQSTLPPQLYRWKRREDMIARVLAAPHIQEMAATFGYRAENMEAWL